MDIWKDCRYKAFVSYSSKDSAHASRIHRWLEAYKLPRPLRGSTTSVGQVPTRLTPLFRDRSDLEAHEDLSQRIETALEQSAWLIVACSPQAAASEWVNKEIAHFKKLGRSDRVIPLLVGGMPSEYHPQRNPTGAFPPALLRNCDKDGELAGPPAPVPFAPDVRPPADDGTGGDGLQFALLKVVSRMTGIELLELTRRQQEAERRERLRYQLIAGGGVSLAALAVLAAWAAWLQRNDALLTESRMFANAASGAIDSSWPDRALWQALHGLPQKQGWAAMVDRPLEPAALARLSGAIADFGTRIKLPIADASQAFFLPGEEQVLVLKSGATVVAEASGKQATRALASDAGYPGALSPDGKVTALTSGSRVLLVDVATGTRLASLGGHSAPIWAIVYSLDGAYLATSASDQTVRIWDARSGAELAALNLKEESADKLAFSRDGKLLLSASRKEVRAWSVPDGRPLRTIQDADVIHIDGGVPLSGERIVSADRQGVIKIWSLDPTKKSRQLKGHQGRVDRIRFSADGTRAVSIAQDSTARIWNVQTGEQVAKLPHVDRWGPGSPTVGGPDLISAEFSPDGQRVLTSIGGGQMFLWDAVSGLLLKTYNTIPSTSDRLSVAASFSPTGARVLAVSSRDLLVLDPHAGVERLTLRGGDGPVNGAMYTVDGRTVVTIHEKFEAICWEVATGRRIRSLKEPGSLFSVLSDRSGKRFLTASFDHVARYWDAETGALLFALAGDGDLKSIAISPDSELLAAAFDSEIRVFEAKSGALLSKLRAAGAPVVNHIEFAPDSVRLVSAGSDGVARVWAARQSRVLIATAAHKKEIVKSTFSPDGKIILTAGADDLASLWEASTGTLLAALRGHDSQLTDALISPDGRFAVTASIDPTVRLWNVRDGQLIAELRGQQGEMGHASFSPDSTRVATAAKAGGIVHVWDTSSGSQISTLRGHSGGIQSVAFSPDGREIVTASSDGTTRVWAAPRGLDKPGALLRDACLALQRYGRTFEQRESADMGLDAGRDQPCR